MDNKDPVSNSVEGEYQHPRLFSDLHICTMAQAYEYTHTHTYFKMFRSYDVSQGKTLKGHFNHASLGLVLELAQKLLAHL